MGCLEGRARPTAHATGPPPTSNRAPAPRAWTVAHAPPSRATRYGVGAPPDVQVPAAAGGAPEIAARVHLRPGGSGMGRIRQRSAIRRAITGVDVATRSPEAIGAPRTRATPVSATPGGAGTRRHDEPFQRSTTPPTWTPVTVCSQRRSDRPGVRRGDGDDVEQADLAAERRGLRADPSGAVPVREERPALLVRHHAADGPDIAGGDGVHRPEVGHAHAAELLRLPGRPVPVRHDAPRRPRPRRRQARSRPHRAGHRRAPSHRAGPTRRAASRTATSTPRGRTRSTPTGGAPCQAAYPSKT